MSPLDASFLQAEDEEEGVSMAVSSIAVFDGPPPSPAEFAGMLTGRLSHIPRYRQKVRQVPLDLGPPVWVDDEKFDLDYHLRRTALPAPGGDGELRTLMGRVMSVRLDRHRPLWEYWLVEDLAGGRWALISKIHHCMVDGVSGTDLYSVILDPTPDPRPSVPDGWAPEPEPSSGWLVALALRDLALAPAQQALELLTALRRPWRLAGQVLDTVRGLVTLSSALVPAGASSLSGPLSAARRFSWCRASVDDVKAVRRALGGTFNDVVLAAVTAGFRTLLIARGEAPAADAVRTMVPVNVRTLDDVGILGNRVSMMLADLPVDIADPVHRLDAVRARMDRLKAGKEAEAVVALTALSRQEPFPLYAVGVRLAARLPHRAFVTVTTNVPGPRQQLFALGRPLVEIIAYVPIGSTLRTGVSIFTYRDRITFGVTGDYDTAADVEALACGIEDGLAALVSAAHAS